MHSVAWAPPRRVAVLTRTISGCTTLPTTLCGLLMATVLKHWRGVSRRAGAASIVHKMGLCEHTSVSRRLAKRNTRNCERSSRATCVLGGGRLERVLTVYMGAFGERSYRLRDRERERPKPHRAFTIGHHIFLGKSPPRDQRKHIAGCCKHGLSVLPSERRRWWKDYDET